MNTAASVCCQVGRDVVAAIVVPVTVDDIECGLLITVGGGNGVGELVGNCSVGSVGSGGSGFCLFGLKKLNLLSYSSVFCSSLA